MQSYRKAGQLAVEKIKEIEIRVADSDAVGRREMLERVAGTALNSKLISRHKPFFSPMVSALLHSGADPRLGSLLTQSCNHSNRLLTPCSV